MGSYNRNVLIYGPFLRNISIGPFLRNIANIADKSPILCKAGHIKVNGTYP